MIKIPHIATILVVATPASAQVTYETVASSDDYGTFAAAQINSSGDIAFHSTLPDGTTSVWRIPSGGSTEKLGRSGDTTSPFRTYGTSYSSFPAGGSPQIMIAAVRTPDLGEDGNVAFATDLLIDDSRIFGWNDSAVWVTGDGTTISRPGQSDSVQCWLAAREGMTVYRLDGAGGNQSEGPEDDQYSFRNFGVPVVGAGGQVAVTGWANDWREVAPDDWEEFRISGTWIYHRPTENDPFDPERYSGRPPFVVIGGSGAPGTGGTLVSPALTPAGGTGAGIISASIADVAPLAADGLWTADSGGLTPLALAGSPSPVPGRNYAQFGSAASSIAGNTAFWAGLDRDEAIFVRRGETTFTAALSGMAAPGFSGGARITSLDDPAMNASGTAAFTAQVGATAALYTGSTPSALHLIARAGESAVGIGDATFEYFGAPRINALGQVAFPAKFRRTDGSTAFGIWAMDTNGDLLLVATEGAPLPGGTIGGVGITDFSNAGELLLDVVFTGGSAALIRASITPASAEDYAAWAAANIPDAGEREPGGDPDGDGNTNLAEFGAGFDPMKSDARITPSITLITTEHGDKTLEAKFQARVPASGVTSQIRISSDLVTWSDKIEIVSASLTGAGMQEIVARELPGTAGGRDRCFVRIIVSD